MPVDPAHVHDFDPTKVPNIEQLLRELDEAIKEDGTEHHSGMFSFLPYGFTTFGTNTMVQDWERTSLAPYVRMLDQHVAGLMKEVRSANRGPHCSCLGAVIFTYYSPELVAALKGTDF